MAANKTELRKTWENGLDLVIFRSTILKLAHWCDALSKRTGYIAATDIGYFCEVFRVKLAKLGRS